MSMIVEMKRGFYWEGDGLSYDNAISIFLNQKDELTIAVTQEQAVDSYNQTFECTAYLSRQDAERLRDYLVKVLSMGLKPTENDHV